MSSKSHHAHLEELPQLYSLQDLPDWQRRAGIDIRESFQPELDRFLDACEREFTHPEPAAVEVPRMDVGETEEAIVFRVELPGMDEEDIQILVNADMMTIRGEKGAELCHAMKAWHYRECSSGRFERVVLIPEGVDSDDVATRYQSGVLTVRMAKMTKPQIRAQRAARKVGLAS